MKINFIKKIICLGLLSVSILGFNSVGASAEWKNNNGNWNYLKADGTKSTGWLRDIDGKYYYLNNNGIMEHDTIINGYQLGSDGSWVQNNTITNNVNSNNTTTNISNINNGIINNGTAKDININNYYGNTNNIQNANQQDINLPFVTPSNWIKISNISYAINSRSPLIYQVKDTFGSNKNDIVNGLELALIEKTNLKYESKTYNGYKSDCFEYLDTTQKGIEKFYNITIFNEDKVYNFVMCGDKDNYETDKNDLENVLNSSLKF